MTPPGVALRLPLSSMLYAEQTDRPVGSLRRMTS
jgi:hypothetical protein